MEELGACGSCRQPIHGSAVRCPRCSAFQRRFRSTTSESTPKGYREAARPPEPAKLARAPAKKAPGSSPAEELDEHDGDPGVFLGLLLPHPRTRGIVRAVELALSLMALPLTASSVVGLALLFIASIDLPWRTRRELRAPAWMVRALGIVTGTAVLLTALETASLPREVTMIVLASQLGIVGARTAIRRAALAPRRARLDLSA